MYHIYIYTYIHTRIHIYITYIHTHIHIHIHTPLSVCGEIGGRGTGRLSSGTGCQPQEERGEEEREEEEGEDDEEGVQRTMGIGVPQYRCLDINQSLCLYACMFVCSLCMYVCMRVC